MNSKFSQYINFSYEKLLCEPYVISLVELHTNTFVFHARGELIMQLSLKV